MRRHEEGGKRADLVRVHLGPMLHDKGVISPRFSRHNIAARDGALECAFKGQQVRLRFEEGGDGGVVGLARVRLRRKINLAHFKLLPLSLGLRKLKEGESMGRKGRDEERERRSRE